MIRSLYDIDEELPIPMANEPGAEYTAASNDATVTYINPFLDKFFKKIFASESSKAVLMAFLNSILTDRVVQTVTYGKNEYPGEIDAEGNAAFDVICTDTDGTTFLVEVQRVQQRFFKERSVFYAGRLISDQAPKGNKNWKYDLKDVYVISLLVGFNLADSKPNIYFHRVGLCNIDTGEHFYDKMQFIYLELKKFNKGKDELHTALDEWLYALKHAPEMNEVPSYLKTLELDEFFQLAQFSNLTTEERTMYRTKQQVEWDNQNALDYAKEEAHEAGLEAGLEAGRLAEKKESARNLKSIGVDIKIIVKAIGLSVEEVMAL